MYNNANLSNISHLRKLEELRCGGFYNKINSRSFNMLKNIIRLNIAFNKYIKSIDEIPFINNLKYFKYSVYYIDISKEDLLKFSPNVHIVPV